MLPLLKVVATKMFVIMLRSTFPHLFWFLELRIGQSSNLCIISLQKLMTWESRKLYQLLSTSWLRFSDLSTQVKIFCHAWKDSWKTRSWISNWQLWKISIFSCRRCLMKSAKYLSNILFNHLRRQISKNGDLNLYWLKTWVTMPNCLIVKQYTLNSSQCSSNFARTR